MQKRLGTSGMAMPMMAAQAMPAAGTAAAAPAAAAEVRLLVSHIFASRNPHPRR